MTGKDYLHLVQHGEKKHREITGHKDRGNKKDGALQCSDLQIHVSPGSCPCAKGYLGISANHCII